MASDLDKAPAASFLPTRESGVLLSCQGYRIACIGACEDNNLILRSRAQHGVRRLSKDEGWMHGTDSQPSFETRGRERSFRMKSQILHTLAHSRAMTASNDFLIGHDVQRGSRAVA